LSAITGDDVEKEGFPEWTPEEFIAMYSKPILFGTIIAL